TRFWIVCDLGLPLSELGKQEIRNKQCESPVDHDAINVDQRFSICNLSKALQSALRLASCSALVICVAAQSRSPSLSQCGCAGRFSKISSRMNGVRLMVSGPESSMCTANAGTRI